MPTTGIALFAAVGAERPSRRRALPITGKDKRALYQALNAERTAAKRTLGLKVKAWRTAAPSLEARTWKAFLAARAAKGDPRAVRRLTRERNTPVTRIRSTGRNALPHACQPTSRGTWVHEIGVGARIRESANLLELVGEPSPDALTRLAGLAVQRFPRSHVQTFGSRAVKEQLEELVRERGLRMVGEREHER